jgi:hypothetical protein
MRRVTGRACALAGDAMRVPAIEKALAEARQFAGRAQAVLNAAKDDKYLFFGSKLTGSLRRQSLELTRALAELRKP